MKRLMILRHAKSSWADSSQDDWQRPLNDRGRRDAPRAGEWLRERGLLPDLIVSSDAVRARSTAEAVAEALGGDTRDIIRHPSLYHAKPQDVFDVLHEVGGDAHSVLIVAHNPGLEELIHQMTGEYHGMVTTGLVVLEVPIEGWRELDSSITASIADTWSPHD